MELKNKKITTRLMGYSVDKLSFILNKSFDVRQYAKIQITPKFDREVTKINENTFLMSLSVSIDDNENKIPFFMDIQISGKFEFTEWENAKLNMLAIGNATSVLYPYLRALVTTISSNANVPPYILPIMNINHLFKKKNQNDSKNN